MSHRQERDSTICELYKEGKTLEQIAEECSLSRARVGRILQKNGLTSKDRVKSALSQRVKFTGIYLTAQAKAALVQISADEDTSMSSFLSNLFDEELKRRGITFEIKKSQDSSLPFEETG